MSIEIVDEISTISTPPIESSESSPDLEKKPIYKSSKTLGDSMEETEQEIARMAEDIGSDPYDEDGNLISQTEVMETPDYLLSNFKTIEDQAKGYKTLRDNYNKTLDKYNAIKKHFGSPDEYIIDAEEGEQQYIMSKASGVIADLKALAKENNFSQELFNTLYNKLSENIQSHLHNTESELAELDNAEERVAIMQSWFRSNFDLKEFPAIKKLPLTKDLVLFFEGVKSKMANNSNMHTGRSKVDAKQATTPEELRKEVQDNYETYKSDPSYRDSVKRRLAAMDVNLRNKYMTRKP